MNSVFAGAMISIMALSVFAVTLPLGGVTPELAFPAYLLIGLFACLWAGKLLFARYPAWSFSPMHWPVLAFIVYAFIRYYTTPIEYEARVELFQIGACGLMYFVCANQFHRPGDRTAFLVIVMVLASLESAYGIWQGFARSDSVFHWIRPEGYQGRGSGTFIYPNHLAGFLELALGLVIARAALIRRESVSLERSVILKVLNIYVALMLVAGIVISRSRGGYLATLAGLSLFWFLGAAPGLQLRWLKPALIALVVIGMGLTLWTIEPVRNHLLGSFSQGKAGKKALLSDPTLGGRVEMWRGTLQIIRDFPTLGTGPGSWQWVFQKYKSPSLLSRPEYAHNDILNLVADYGLVGAALMVAILVGFFWHALVMARQRGSPEQQAFAVGAMVSVAAILVHCWFDFILHIPATSLLLAAILGTTAAMSDDKGRFQAKPLGRLPRYTIGLATLAFCGFGLWAFIPTAWAARLTDLGNALKSELDYQGAKSYFEAAIARDPKAPEPYARAGDIYRTMATFRTGPDKAAERQGLARQAIESYSRSLALNPYQSFVLVEKARAQELAGENELARQSYQRAIEVYPENGHAFYRLGCFLRDRGDRAGALEAFKKANSIFYSPEAALNQMDLEMEPQR